MTFDVQEYRAFLELLYKHPEWREELRQLVLTEELLKLPELVHELTEAHKRSEARLAGVEERLTRIEQSIAELVEITKQHEERLAGVEERLAKVEARLEGVEERLTRLEESVAQLVEVQKQHEARLTRVEARLDGVEERLTRIERSIAELVEITKQHEARLTGVEDRLTRIEQSIAELVEITKQHEARLTRLEESVAQLVEVQKQHEERLAKVEQSIIELTEAQKRTEQQVQRLTDRMGQMAGDLLEIKYRDKPSSYFGRIVRQARLVDLADVEAMLGERLSDEQLFDLLQLDLVVHGQLRQFKGKRKEQPEVWLAIEVSAVVDREDVERAERRAEILRQAGLPVLAVAAGGNLTLGALELAQAKGVVLQADGRLEFLEEALAKLMN
jgi:myosin heavy subunit